MTKTIGLIALLTAVAASSPAQAQEEGTVIVRVSRADLALSDRSLHHKIAMAIEEVCGSYAVVESSQWPTIDDCRSAAWSGVRQQLAELKSSETVRLSAR